MREIKFRAWHIERKRYLEVIELLLRSKLVVVYSDKPNVVTESFGFGNIILEQYTGLKDKNGVEIYEGDILAENYGAISDYDKLYVVKFDEDRQGYHPLSRGDGCGCCETETYGVEFIEVIGNIHENGDLLK